MELPDGALVVTLRFPSNNEARVAVVATPETIDGAPFEWAAGLDGMLRLGAASTGAGGGAGERTSDDTSVMDVDTLWMMDTLRLTFVFSREELALTVEDTYFWRPNPRGCSPPMPANPPWGDQGATRRRGISRPATL